MPNQPPPSNAVFARAAELRVGGATWKTVAREVRRAERTVRRWPRYYPDRWFAALLQAERLMTAQADNESLHTLRCLLASKDEKVRWHAAKSLIVRRIERDKIELKTQTREPQRPLTDEARELIYFLEGHSNDQLEEIIDAVRPHALPAPGGGQACP